MWCRHIPGIRCKGKNSIGTKKFKEELPRLWQFFFLGKKKEKQNRSGGKKKDVRRAD